MAALENDPALREQALLFEAEAFKAAGKWTVSHSRSRKIDRHRRFTISDAMRGAIMLAHLYAQKGDGGKALKALERFTRRSRWWITSLS